MIKYFANKNDIKNITLRTQEKIKKINNEIVKTELQEIIFPFSFSETKKTIENLIKYEKMIKANDGLSDKNDLQEINKIIIDLTVTERVFQIN